jgi:aspartate-semialdehyde dehydrogenase
MISRDLKVGVVGATGMVGTAFMDILAERNFPIAELRPFASEASIGKQILLAGKSWPVQILDKDCFKNLDLVFFSSGDEVSQKWAPEAVQAGAIAIDNSAAFRMHELTDLVVPEVNGHLLAKNKKARVIANPNCSTIQLVVALKPLSEAFGLREVRVSTYQSVSGAGQPGYDELLSQTRDYQNLEHSPKAFQKTILFNVIPQIGSFGDHGFCSEEIKIMQETRKIMNLPKLKITAMTVRVPSLNAHSEAVWVELDQIIHREQFISALKGAEGLVIQDDITRNDYPTPREISGKDPVYVGRIHRDLENPYLWLMWVVSDNIRKGAALNGIQIAERCF